MSPFESSQPAGSTTGAQCNGSKSELPVSWHEPGPIHISLQSIVQCVSRSSTKLGGWLAWGLGMMPQRQVVKRQWTGRHVPYRQFGAGQQPVLRAHRAGAKAQARRALQNGRLGRPGERLDPPGLLGIPPHFAAGRHRRVGRDVEKRGVLKRLALEKDIKVEHDLVVGTEIARWVGGKDQPGRRPVSQFNDVGNRPYRRGTRVILKSHQCRIFVKIRRFREERSMGRHREAEILFVRLPRTGMILLLGN